MSKERIMTLVLVTGVLFLLLGVVLGGIIGWDISTDRWRVLLAERGYAHYDTLTGAWVLGDGNEPTKAP